MNSDLAVYGLLASIFIIHGLRMFIEKPMRVSDRSSHAFDRFRRSKSAKTGSHDS